MISKYIILFIWVVCGVTMCWLQQKEGSYCSTDYLHWYDVLVNLFLGPIKLSCWLIAEYI